MTERPELVKRGPGKPKLQELVALPHVLKLKADVEFYSSSENDVPAATKQQMSEELSIFLAEALVRRNFIVSSVEYSLEVSELRP